MKKMLAVTGMCAWCALSVWLQIHYLRSGITLGEWCIATVCVVPFYAVLFIASHCNIKKKKSVRKSRYVL